MTKKAKPASDHGVEPVDRSQLVEDLTVEIQRVMTMTCEACLATAEYNEEDEVVAFVACLECSSRIRSVYERSIRTLEAGRR